MGEFISLIRNKEQSRIAERYFQDADVMRLSLRLTEQTQHGMLYGRSKLWIDPEVDGCHDMATRRAAWQNFIERFPNSSRLNEASFMAKPENVVVRAFVNKVLDQCAEWDPSWITVPLLPICSDNSRNKLCRTLAGAAGHWKATSGFRGRLILPIIFTHQSQINGKVARNRTVQLAEKCYKDSGADGFWVVDSTLSDDGGQGTLQGKRIPSIIAFHEELNTRVSSELKIAGPYWGLNLILWAKGLIEYPLIGLGTGYQYLLSGGIVSAKPKARIAIPALRRRVSAAAQQLGDWLDSAASSLPKEHPARGEFVNLRKRLSLLTDQSLARRQVAEFYRYWINIIASVPRNGRSMALFQDLASSYALGKVLPAFKHEKGALNRPEVVTAALMNNCL